SLIAKACFLASFCALWNIIENKNTVNITTNYFGIMQAVLLFNGFITLTVGTVILFDSKFLHLHTKKQT
ncbi:hypothetical protein KAU11_07425, partial [Candidatus Babeliales bacterium]|nr:hypothetical protein [Candidatus Babeliales bacterium]